MENATVFIKDIKRSIDRGDLIPGHSTTGDYLRKMDEHTYGRFYNWMGEVSRVNTIMLKHLVLQLCRLETGSVNIRVGISELSKMEERLKDMYDMEIMRRIGIIEFDDRSAFGRLYFPPTGEYGHIKLKIEGEQNDV